MLHHRDRWSVAGLGVLAAFSSWTITPPPALAADAPPAAAPAPPAPPAPPGVRTRLPDEHPYQKTLRDYLATLKASDYDHGVTAEPTVVPTTDAEEVFHNWVLSLEFPRVGRKRSAPSVNLPGHHFTLAEIETPQGVVRPSCWPETAAFLANWKNPGNPYFGSKALKLRAFTTTTLLMLMTDDLQEHSGQLKDARSDWFGPHFVCYAYVYPLVRDAVPAEARAAYETCLFQMMQRVDKWGPRHDETHFDVCAVLGMRLAGDAIGTPKAKKLAETYAKRVFDDRQFFHPAGYFTDQGGFDVGFEGMSLYWGTWLAVAAPDWPWAQEAVKKAWRLRAYLLLPEPDGAQVGPSHFNARLSNDALADQWNFPFRNAAAMLLTDDAICQQPHNPEGDRLKNGLSAAVNELIMQLHENPGSGEYVPPEKLRSSPWRWSMWPDSPIFPMNNFAYDHFPKGFAARYEKLVQKDPSLLQLPMGRPGTFTENFDKEFLVAKRKGFGVILHTGPVADWAGEGHMEMAGPLGLGGGSLSAFWTPATGSVIVGRRGGQGFPNAPKPNWDTPELWRSWPVHAVSGTTAAGKPFSSSRILDPKPVYDIEGKTAHVKVGGVIPAQLWGRDPNLASLKGKLDFARAFTLDDKGLTVETSVGGDGADSVAELYEMIPVFVREGERQVKPEATAIEFEVDGKLQPATEQFAAKVSAVRLTRYGASVRVRFDRPRRVKLSEADWATQFIGHVVCRNVLVDLLESDDKPATITGAKTVGYRIEPEGK
ncbi:MAG: hypothetical protein NTW19_04785 [Planctomycetota bacterium]|nr:hypothetical protein [Planctomycetota bacterium]